MIMRRSLWASLALLLVAAAMVVGTWSTPIRVARATSFVIDAIARSESRFEMRSRGRAGALARLARIPLGLMLGHTVQPAWADDVLQFKPVSADSAARLEAHNRRAHEAAAQASPAAPATPASHSRSSAHAQPVHADTLTPLPPDASPAPDATPPEPPRHSGEMMRIGSDIHVERDQTIEGDVVAISGDVRVDGHVKGSVQSLGGDVYLGSTARVDGDVAAVKGELHEEPGAYVGGQRVTALGGSTVHMGRHSLRPLVEAAGNRSVRQLVHFGTTLAWLLLMLGIVWLVIRITPHRTGVALDLLRRETAASLGVGLLTWVLIVPSIVALALVVAILCITIIGIPVAIAALMAYALFLIVLTFWGFIVGAAWLSGQVGGTIGKTLLYLALTGTLLIVGMRAIGHLIGVAPFLGFLGGMIVVVGWCLSGAATTLGAGALLRSEFASGQLGMWWRRWRGEPTLAPAGGVGSAPGGPVMPPAPAGFGAPTAQAPPAPPATYTAPAPPSPDVYAPPPAPYVPPAPYTPPPPYTPPAPPTDPNTPMS
jgi:Polymer-forming cytoskeletal